MKKKTSTYVSNRFKGVKFEKVIQGTKEQPKEEIKHKAITTIIIILVILGLVMMCLSSCGGDLPRTNPFDPQNPQNQGTK